jgi:putative transcriptional regulator
MMLTEEYLGTSRLFQRLKSGPHGQLVGHEAIAIARSEADPSTYHIHVPSDLDVRAIRLRTGLSQDKFAERFGFTRARVRDWEQGRSKPDGAVRAYLIVIDREREAVERALTERDPSTDALNRRHAVELNFLRAGPAHLFVGRRSFLGHCRADDRDIITLRQRASS